MKTHNHLFGEVARIKAAVIEAIPPGVSLISVIMALADLIKQFGQQCFEEEQNAPDNR